jgi:hypothetical protein
VKTLSRIFFSLLAAGFRSGVVLADLLLPRCQNVAILEGYWGVMNCTVQNNGDLDVQIDGSWVVGVPIGPDLSDLVIAIVGVGDQFPVISAHGNHTFQYVLFTPPEFDFDDLGLSIIEPIYSGVDDCTINIVDVDG